MVMTVTGEASAADLGITYMHEHVIACSPGLYVSYPQLWDRQIVFDRAVSDLTALKSRGLSTIVDMTPSDFHRDPELVRDISEATGVRFVHATGAYWYTTIFFKNRDEELISSLFVHDITTGMNGTDVRAGILKAATGVDGVTPENGKLLRAIARAHLETGVPISTHTDMKSQNGLGQVEVFEAAGVDMSHVVIGHSGDVRNVEYIERLIEHGCYVGLDRFGLETQLPDDERLAILQELCEKGYAERIVLSHDSCCFGDFGAAAFFNQPRWNWFDLLDRILPELRTRGIAESAITQMMVTNPARIFGA